MLQLLQKWAIAINTPNVKIVRILYASNEEEMINAFCKFMLALDTEQEDLVLLLEQPFSNLENFGKELVEEIEKEIVLWNQAEIPESFNFKTIEWKPDYTLGSENNHGQIFIKNLNSLANYLVAKKDIKVSVVIRMHGADSKQAYTWFHHVLQTSIEEHVIIGIDDSEDFRIYDKLSKQYPQEVYTLKPNLSMDDAIEELAMGLDPSKPTTPYRTNLIKLMNAVKNRKKDKTKRYAEKCLEIAAKELKTDPNWLSQIVTIYTILYSDQIGYKQYNDAIYFAGKAVEAALLTRGLLDPSMSYRLIGQAHIGRGGMYNVKKKRSQALDDYIIAAEAYEHCEDHLLHCESLRLCGWMCEKLFDHKEAVQYYIKAYQLHEKLAPDVLRNSTFPYVIKKLLGSSTRREFLSTEQMDQDLAPIFGEKWEDTIYQYGKAPKPQTNSI
ncbi:tetratricopeptide repeat protein [Aquimarina litoralis]|uniref:tetratricopeptide repeat protein n=1 Tax=Aquimarina litoralis TaxID=584605 RepID=UPI001C5603FE|nr:tetratricopeptide repeat protein [Aquimarina litoralis]